MNLRSYSFGVVVLLALSLVACKEDEDTTAPTIDLFTVNEETEDVEVPAGTEMHIDLELADNEELREYKIDIHDAFDGHGHGKMANFQKFSHLETITISGKEATEHKHIDVPTTAMAGPYHCIIRVIDEEGNEGEFGEVDFKITNNGQAQINLTSPDFSGHVHVDKGDTLTLTGDITDDVDIAEIVIELEEEHEGEHHHGGKVASESPLYEADIDLGGSSDVSWEFAQLTDPIAVPANAEDGHYKLKIKVEDSDGNLTLWENEVHIE